jgi:hypothetical protein
MGEVKNRIENSTPVRVARLPRAEAAQEQSTYTRRISFGYPGTLPSLLHVMAMTMKENDHEQPTPA